MRRASSSSTRRVSQYMDPDPIKPFVLWLQRVTRIKGHMEWECIFAFI